MTQPRKGGPTGTLGLDELDQEACCRFLVEVFTRTGILVPLCLMEETGCSAERAVSIAFSIWCLLAGTAKEALALPAAGSAEELGVLGKGNLMPPLFAQYAESPRALHRWLEKTAQQDPEGLDVPVGRSMKASGPGSA